LVRAQIQSWLSHRFLGNWLVEPWVPILHPSPWRLRLLGLTLAIGHPLFGWIWSAWLPQPYENGALRAVMAALALLLTLPWLARNLSSTSTRVIASLIAWLQFPVFFSWMYFCNGTSVAWLASVSTMILIYYHLTDWRLATLGTVLGGALAWLLYLGLAPNDLFLTSDDVRLNLVVIGFSWACAILLGLSSANLRREQLARALQTMGIMAHELRTPLSTAALIGDAVELESQKLPAGPQALQLRKLATRLHALVRNMNHQIDTEIANAKLLDLPRHHELVLAGPLVRDVVQAYPYALSRQRDCVRVVMQEDFMFRSSRRQFSQVLDNLIKNALHSLMAADSKYAPGALRLEVKVSHGRGQIVVTDDGMGMDAATLSQIFKPFFSSNHGTGHGLGLAFCQRVVQSAGGTIEVKSAYALGASFTLDLPMVQHIDLKTTQSQAIF
jgi:two-component system, CAI-1 autoinducer sensor kinase/phosphatase CqsS